MSKLLWSGIAIALISSIGIAQAQLPPDSKPPTPQSQPTSPTSTPLKATDLPLVTRAIGKFLQTDRAETESQIEIDSQNEKGRNKYFLSVKTIAQVGGKFYSELTINRVGQTSKTKYTIVSNGKKAWIYRPDLRQYAEMSKDDFTLDPSATIIGFSSFILTSMDEKQRENLIIDILGEYRQIISLANSKPFQLSQQKIDNRNLSLYTNGNSSDGNFEIKISGFIYPQTAMLERTEIKLRDREKFIEVVEKIVKRNPEVIVNNKTFTFSPPKGVKKVKSLQIIGSFKF